MLASSRPIAFVPITAPARARAFYEGVLGLRLLADEPFALVFDVAGVMLRLSKTLDSSGAKVEQLTPAPYTVLGWHVPDIHETVRGLRARGVTFLRYEGLPQDDDGVWTTPAGHKIAWFHDPDGNTLSLTEG